MCHNIAFSGAVACILVPLPALCIGVGQVALSAAVLRIDWQSGWEVFMKRSATLQARNDWRGSWDPHLPLHL